MLSFNATMPAQHNLLPMPLNLEFGETINQTLSFRRQTVSYFAALSLIKPVHILSQIDAHIGLYHSN